MIDVPNLFNAVTYWFAMSPVSDAIAFGCVAAAGMMCVVKWGKVKIERI